jgi:hypothetical protein
MPNDRQHGGTKQMETTTEARAKAGWYPHKAMPGMLRYWSGETWARDVPPRPALAKVPRPESASGWIFGGFLVSLLGGAVMVFGGPVMESAEAGLIAVFVGAVVVSLGGICVTIGTIAVGVRLGMHWAYYERWQRDRLD